MIKVIIFDWGNVIAFYPIDDFLDKMSSHFNVDKELFQKVELQNRLKHDLGEISTKEFIGNLSKGINRNVIVKEYYSLHQKFGQGKLNEELISLIKNLKKRYKIFLLSNNSKPTYDSIVKSSLKKIFDKILFSYQVGIKKPNKEFFFKILEDTTFSPKNCLFIDDREDVCIAAKKYGFNTIVFKNNEQLKKELVSSEVKVD